MSDATIYYLERALEAAKCSRTTRQEDYDTGYADGVRSMQANVRAQVTGKQFLARLMTQVSPDSAAWAELHEIAERGFGNSLEVRE